MPLSSRGDRRPFGVLPDGDTVKRCTIGSTHGVEVSVLTLGAIVHEVWVPDGRGHRVNVVLGAPDVDAYLRESDSYYGAVIGRVANRIAGAALPIGEALHHLPANDGAHTLHGGPEGFHRRLWTVEAQDECSVDVAMVSPDGDQGFPGKLTTRVCYRVVDTEVSITYTATTTGTTPVALTQHAHFNLAGEGNGDVEDHLLTVAADRYSPVAEDLIPLGTHEEVMDTPFDLRSPRILGGVLSDPHPQLALGNGIDDNFVLSSGPGEAAARLEDPASGRVLDILTDQPGLQVYTGNAFDGTHVGTGGRAYPARAGVALETQMFPDAVHHDGEDGWPSPLLRAGQTVQTTTRWRFGTAS